MAKVKVRLIGLGKADDPYRVPLPTYQMVEADYTLMTAVVLIPDDEVKEGKIDRERIKEKYPEWYEINKKEFDALEELSE